MGGLNSRGWKERKKIHDSEGWSTVQKGWGSKKDAQSAVQTIDVLSRFTRAVKKKSHKERGMRMN